MRVDLDMLIDAAAAQATQIADHPLALVCRRVLLHHHVARRLDRLDLRHAQLQPVEKTLDRRQRRPWDPRAVRLPQLGELLALVAPQALEATYSQGRQNAVDPVQQRVTLPNQILPLAMRAPNLFLDFARHRNRRAHARLAPQPREQREEQHLGVDRIRLRPSRSAATGKVDACITWSSIPRRIRKRASQKPSRPASCVTTTRTIGSPAATLRACIVSSSVVRAGPFGSNTYFVCLRESGHWTANTHFFELSSNAPISVLS